MSENELTKKQLKVLNYIKGYIAKNKIPPSRQEITDSQGFASPNSATEYLNRLAGHGCIRLIPGVSRGIVVL